MSRLRSLDCIFSKVLRFSIMPWFSLNLSVLMSLGTLLNSLVDLNLNEMKENVQPYAFEICYCPRRVKNFRFSMASRPALGSTQPPIQSVPGVKRPGREPSAGVKKIWIYTSTPIRFQGVVLNYISTETALPLSVIRKINVIRH
jgi:hypothetical protein